jgi:hypothetical protein
VNPSRDYLRETAAVIAAADGGAPPNPAAMAEVMLMRRHGPYPRRREAASSITSRPSSGSESITAGRAQVVALGCLSSSLLGFFLCPLNQEVTAPEDQDYNDPE